MKTKRKPRTPPDNIDPKIPKVRSPLPRTSPPDEGDETLEALLKRLGIADWDFLIVGDGSGSNWTREAGWGAVSIERATMDRMVWSGSVSRGTVNLAEMMAYLQPLEWLASRESDKRKKGGARAFDIHIVTDSDYCRTTGNSSGRMMSKNAGLWAVFDAFARHGFVLHWHWIPRENCELNRYCDKLSKLARKTAKKYNPQDVLIDDEVELRTVYEINPDEG